jgi:hypothetical protein
VNHSADILHVGGGVFGAYTAVSAQISMADSKDLDDVAIEIWFGRIDGAMVAPDRASHL